MSYDYRPPRLGATKLYHGSPTVLRKLVPDPADRQTLNSLGVWLTSSAEAATLYGEHIHEATLPAGKFLEAKKDDLEDAFYDAQLARKLGLSDWNDCRLNWDYLTAFRAKLKKAGYRGIVWRNSFIDRDREGGESPHDVYLVFTPGIAVRPHR